MALPNIWETAALNDYYSSCITFKCNRFLENEQQCIHKQFSILALVSINRDVGYYNILVTSEISTINITITGNTKNHVLQSVRS